MNKLKVGQEKSYATYFTLFQIQCKSSWVNYNAPQHTYPQRSNLEDYIIIVFYFNVNIPLYALV